MGYISVTCVFKIPLLVVCIEHYLNGTRYCRVPVFPAIAGCLLSVLKNMIFSVIYHSLVSYCRFDFYLSSLREKVVGRLFLTWLNEFSNAIFAIFLTVSVL